MDNRGDTVINLSQHNLLHLHT